MDLVKKISQLFLTTQGKENMPWDTGSLDMENNYEMYGNRNG